MKRRLFLDNQHANVENIEGGGAPPVAMITNGITKPNTNPKEVMEKERSKRSKKDGANSTSLGSAGSREGSVRSQ